MFFRGQLVDTASASSISNWANFPAVAAVNLSSSNVSNVGTITNYSNQPLTLGTSNGGLVMNSTIESHNNGSTLYVIDNGNDILNTADFSVEASNGNYGFIELLAKPGSAVNPIQNGGFINIEADSFAGSIQPTALSRVNVEAATLTLAAGAVGALAFVPGSVNILSGAGTGVQVLTTAGPINIAGGTTATLAGGTGVFFNGGATGVKVNAGDFFVNQIQPNGSAGTSFTSAILTNGVNSYNTGRVAIPQLDIISPTNTIAFGVSGSQITANVSGGSGGIGSATTIFVSSQSGNDTTGNGSPTLPFLTIGKALTVAATFADSIPVAINLYAGTYTETVTVTRNNTFINGLSSIAQECYINGVVTYSVTTTTEAFITGGMSGVRMNSLVCDGTPTVQVNYNFLNCVMISPSTVVPFTASQGGSVSYTVVMDGCVMSPTDTRAAGITSVAVSFLRCLLSVLTQNSVVLVQGNGTVFIDNSELSSSYTGTNAGALLSISNTVSPTGFHRVSQSRLFYTSTTTDVTGTKCCIRFLNTAAVNAVVDNCSFNCVGAITGTPLIQCIQRTASGAVNLLYGNIQAVSPAVWISPTITRTILNNVQQGVNAVGGGAGDFLTWDGNQWAAGSSNVSIGRGSGNVADVTCVNVGLNAGTTANSNAVAIGNGAGGTAANGAISIGQNAGTSAGASAISIGGGAGQNCGSNSISIGGAAQAAGVNCIAIGNTAANGSSPAFTNCIVISADGTALAPAASSTCKINPIRNAGATPATFTASSSGTLTYNNTTKEVSFNTTSYRCSVVVAPSTLALNPTLLGNTFIVTGTGTLTITTTGFVIADAGFFVYLKNGTVGATADITLAGVTGATTLHQPSGSQNGQIVVLFWNGTSLVAY